MGPFPWHHRVLSDAFEPSGLIFILGGMMANVLIGIVGVILFIGLALAGASFFGPVLNDSVVEARASGLVQSLSTVAKAVSVRNRELETLTPGSSNSNVLVPDYLSDLPTNPINGQPLMLVTDAGSVTGGMARIVASRLTSTDAALCGYVNGQGGGGTTVPVVSTMPIQSIGCARAGSTLGTFAAGDYFAYMTIN